AIAAARKRLLSPFNVFAAVVVVVGLILLWIRFTRGLGAVTNLSNPYPWGLWIGFDVLCGEALAAGGFTLAAAVYLLGLQRYRPLLRPAILTGLLGYIFAGIAVLIDLGRPWRFPIPLFYSFGVSSVMFLVIWLVVLYIIVQFIEFSPAIFEKFGFKTACHWIRKLTVPIVIAAVIIATLHQSALGALFLLAPTKLHPLWYSPLIPVFFFVSSIIAGLAMVIFESAVSHRIFRSQADPAHVASLDELTLGLGRAAAVALFCYFFLKWIGVARGRHWDLLTTPMGLWFLVEMLIFVLLPCLLFAWGVRRANASLVRVTGLLTVIGIVINRLNVSVIALRWNYPQRYWPHWMELTITICIITVGVLTFRWIVNRMPVLREHPDYKAIH
ncbi:MAG: NrfD/PsrC family molybdoenzyme membrane anchor subunit, partial [Phycisphaerae bacterium]